MTKHAIGVFNGNWKNRWNRESLDAISLTEVEDANLKMQLSRQELAAAKSYQATRPDFTKFHLANAFSFYWQAYQITESLHDECTCDPRNPDAPACSHCRAQEKEMPF